MAYQSHLESTGMDDAKSDPKVESNKKNIAFKVVQEAKEIEIEDDKKLNVLAKRI